MHVNIQKQKFMYGSKTKIHVYNQKEKYMYVLKYTKKKHVYIQKQIYMHEIKNKCLIYNIFTIIFSLHFHCFKICKSSYIHIVLAKYSPLNGDYGYIYIYIYILLTLYY